MSSSPYIFGMADYAQIEFRLTAWYAGQEDLVQALREGRDIYSEFATDELFRTPIRKPKETDPEPVKRILTFKRGFAKDGMLGFTYGMGGNRLYGDCLKNDSLRPLFDSGKYDYDFIDRLIKTLRQKYSKIPQFWRDVEKAWRFVTKYPNEVVDMPIILNEAPLGLQFCHQDGATFIYLPSGRYLRYPQARVKRDGSLAYRWSSNIWGGHITENIMQATSRDIMGEALLRLEDEGIGHVFHVYDEVISLFPVSPKKETPPKDAKLVKEYDHWMKSDNSLTYQEWYWTKQIYLKKMMDVMCVVPEWATGLPIAVEGELSERYKK